MAKVNFFGKPLPTQTACRFVDILSAIMMLLLLAITWVAYTEQLYEMLMLTPVVTAYVVTTYAYLTTKLRKEFKHDLQKTKINKRPM
jgi:hypothetical protein